MWALGQILCHSAGIFSTTRSAHISAVRFAARAKEIRMMKR
jgi:hypothetical protein